MLQDIASGTRGREVQGDEDLYFYGATIPSRICTDQTVLSLCTTVPAQRYYGLVSITWVLTK